MSDQPRAELEERTREQSGNAATAKRGVCLAAASCVLILALAGPAASADKVAAKGARIVEVTVFRDRAEVVREARVDLPAGASTVELEDIPFGVEADSLRVSAEGVPAVLGAVELRQRAEKPVESTEFLAAREEVRRLEGEIAALKAESDVDAQLLTYLSSLRHVRGGGKVPLPSRPYPTPPPPRASSSSSRPD